MGFAAFPHFQRLLEYRPPSTPICYLPNWTVVGRFVSADLERDHDQHLADESRLEFRMLSSNHVGQFFAASDSICDVPKAPRQESRVGSWELRFMCW